MGRLFVGVAMPDEARQALAAHLGAALDDKPVPGKPVPPENWHLTLRFLGTTEEVAYEKLLSSLDQADLGDAFRLSLGGLGAFPRGQRATVLWVGVEHGAERLGELAAAAEEAARAAGFDAEDRPFHAHLTLSRIRPHQDVRVTLARVPPPPIRWEVSEVVVYRSHLGGRRPARYEMLEGVPLRPA